MNRVRENLCQAYNLLHLASVINESPESFQGAALERQLRRPFRIHMKIFLYSFSTFCILLFSTSGHTYRVYMDGPLPGVCLFETVSDTIPPLTDRENDFLNDPVSNPYDLEDPAAVEQTVEYDPETGNYIIYERIGEEFFRTPSYMTFEEYLDWSAEQQERQYFQSLSGINTGAGSGGLIDPIQEIDIENLLIDRLFGGTDIEITPRGNIDLIFAGRYQRVLNPNIPIRAQRQAGFDFDMNINLSVEGRIGKKLNLAFNYNTGATFDFDNQMKLDYNSAEFSEDDILKRIEAGNVSLPLRNSLIQGSQSLFGILAELQFGRLRLTTVISQQRSQRQQIQLDGGAQLRRFEVRADEYDEFRHFFLTHFNRNIFERACANLPQINSQFKIRRLEVYITNDRQEFQDIRDIVAIADLGEPSNFTASDSLRFKPPSPRHFDPVTGQALPGQNIGNGVYANDILQEILRTPGSSKSENVVRVLQSPPFNFQQGKDFEKIQARKLNTSEYTFHQELGFISLNVNVRPDQVLGVAFEYDFNGKTYKVGQFSQDNYDIDSSGVLFVKMLKGTTPNVTIPLWDLMMKNVYSLGAYQANREDFYLDIAYDDPGGGQKRFLPILPEVPLLQIFNLDNLNVQSDPAPDGVFDYVPGLTIFPRTGRMMFPVLEPFGSSLSRQLPDDPEIQQEYVYQVLYDSTVWRAREYPSLNRFVIRGQYKSSVSSEISLGAFNLPRGSVIVRAGGQTLREGVDYEVDYSIGRVRILNDAYLSSGVPINVSFEDKTLFGFQTKTLMGVRADYMASKKLTLGGTYMHLFERPFTRKVNLGDDPINNKVYGFDLNYSTDAPWLTRAVDALPFVSTKAPSTFALTTEFAALQPGHSRAINQGQDEEGDKDKSGVVYLDDFEGSTTSDDLRLPTTFWVMSSVPQDDGPNPRYPEANLINDLRSGVNRAKLSWYRTDITLRNDEDKVDPYAKLVRQTEIFQNAFIAPNQNDFIQTLDLTYYPNRRGPYNFDLPDGTDFSPGLEFVNIENDTTVYLKEPEERWAGMMRRINNTDFEQANYEFVEFWLLNPFMENRNGEITEQGDLYINIGNISEDILRDSRMFFEDGLPRDANEPAPDTTNLGLIPRKLSLINAFDQNEAARALQDVGFDGMADELEAQFFEEYLNALQSGGAPPQVLDAVSRDPANDNYSNFRTEGDKSVYDRYYNFNNPQGNSPVVDASTRIPGNATARPDREDINLDNSLNETEAYYEYHIPLRRGNQLSSGNYSGFGLNFADLPFVTDTLQGETGVWYRFKVPIDQYTKKVGNVQDFRSMRFIRMYLTGFNKETTLRFARLELVRSNWRRYRLRLDVKGQDGPVQCTARGSRFDINDVNIEENGARAPFNYVLPRGIEREQSLGPFPDALQNEQSLSLTVCDMPCGDNKAVYRNLQYDMRVYDRMKMFVHAEVDRPEVSPIVEDGDVSVFVRIGSDFTNNYYEYEVPLTFSKAENIVGLRNSDDEYIDEVWHPENNIDFSLKMLRDLKLQRNDESGPGGFFKIADPENPENTISIIGNPNLGNVKSIMIGVRNNTDFTFSGKCVEVWVNELRLSGLDDRPGYAAMSRVDMKLADLGELNLEGNYSSIGYGAIDQRVNQRSREEVLVYNTTAELQLGRFLPESSGIRIPFLAQYYEERRNPEFDPYDFDVPLKDKLYNADSQGERDSIRQLAQDFTRIQSIGFNNVRKERTGGGKPMPWDIENFRFTYGWTETYRRTPLVLEDRLTVHNGGFEYGYQMTPLTIAPFKKLIKKDKYFKWLSEMNINLIPNSFRFTTDLDRSFRITRYRFTGTDIQNPANTFFNKFFTWNRQYALNWDIAKNLRFNYNANVNSVIDEPLEFDAENNRISNQVRRDSIWNNILMLGRPKNYVHNLNVSYNVPTKNFPFLDWVNVKAQYDASYSWAAASLNMDSLGNVISNNQTRQVSGDLNFETLYNKSNFLRKINRGNSGSRSRIGSSRGGGGGPATRGGKDDDKGKSGEPSAIAKALIRPLMMLRKARLTVSEDFSTIVPGFMPRSSLMGLSSGFNAPGWDFVAGWQPDIAPGQNDWLRRAADQGWMTESYFLSQEVLQNYSQTIDARITIEPITDFRVELSANKQYTDNLTLSFRDSVLDNYVDPSEIVHMNPRENGSFTVSYNMLNTLFGENPEILFKRFEANRVIISRRLGDIGIPHQDPEQAALGFTDGFGALSQDVLIPAFLATYTGQDPNTFPLISGKSDFKSLLPKLNWQVSYNGLARLPGMDKIFSGFNLTHGYRSTMTINDFQTNGQGVFAPANSLNDNFDFFSAYVIPNIQITEQFAPLIGLDVKLQNEMSIRLDMQRGRNLALSFVDYKLVETQRTNYVFGFGYVLKDFSLPFLETERSRRARARQQQQNNNNNPNDPTQQDRTKDLNIQIDFSFGDDRTLVHLIDQDGAPQDTRGARRITFSPSAEYDLNDQLSLRFFLDYNRSVPYVSNAFPITNWRSGINVRFRLN